MGCKGSSVFKPHAGNPPELSGDEIRAALEGAGGGPALPTLVPRFPPGSSWEDCSERRLQTGWQSNLRGCFCETRHS